MATTGTYTLQAFIDDLERITSEETAPERITERAAPLLGRLVQDPSTISPQYLRSTPQSRGRYMLHRAPRFNITAVVWRPGDTAGAHNHETWGVIGVIDNEIEETRYRVSERAGRPAQLEVTSVKRHRRGDVSRLVPGDEVHRMHNPTARDTVEIHVYGKDLVNLRRKQWADDGTERPLVSTKYLNC